jgi:hypothetical protein
MPCHPARARELVRKGKAVRRFNRGLYGGTLSHGFKRGSLVKHSKLGITYVGGYLKDRISLHSLTDGKRLC